MSAPLQHTIIRASAGSGKTYQLANRFIALLLLQALAGKISPDRLVAVTFTRKGAGEFAERILSRLARAAENEKDCQKLRRDLELLINGDPAKGVAGLAPGVSLTLDRPALQQALAVLVDQFDRLVLGTIDSFMSRSVQTLAFELGLGGFEILEDPAAERARQDMLGEVFRAVPAGELEAFYQRLKVATLRSSANLRWDLDSFVSGYHKLLQHLDRPEAWGGAAFWNGTPPPPANDAWRQAALQLLEQVKAMTFDSKDVANYLAASLQWLAERSPGLAGAAPPAWLNVKGAGAAAQRGKLLQLWPAWPEDWDCYPRSNSKKPCRVPAAVMRPLRAVLQGWLAAETRALADKTAAIFQVVSDYERVYDRQARRQGRLSFEDLPLLLRAGTGGEAALHAIELLAFRWFQQFDHWLLDEFQDTSRVQWSVLQPWLDETLQDDSGVKSVFVVGDAKQSIYGWRGGEPRLFAELSAAYPQRFAEQVMAQSWRSRPAVLELVNSLCDPERNAALGDDALFAAAARARWQYDRHECVPAREDRPGYAAVVLAAEPAAAAAPAGGAGNGEAEEEEDKLVAQARTIRAVLNHLDPLAKGMSCAILTRKNQSARAVAQWLRANGVPNVMVEGDATLADQSPVVAALVDALRWLDTPAHSFAAGHIQLTPLWPVLCDAAPPAKDPAATAGGVWRHWRLRVAEIGAAEVTRQWCALLAAAVADDYNQYCLRQVDQAAWRLGGALTLPDWLAMLAQLTVRETSTAGSIHVMTIHKAKGLGFDVVFLPDLDFGGGGRDDILLRRDARGVATGCLVPPVKWLRAWVPELERLKAAQDAERDLEDMCVLYVALTRAKEATFVILEQERPARGAKARDWILGGIGGPAAARPAPWGGGGLIWESGVCELAAAAAEAAGDTVSWQPGLKLPPPVARRQRRRPSDAGHAKDAQDEGTLPAVSVNRGGAEFGTAVHQVFEQIEWWRPGLPLAGGVAELAAVHKCMAVDEIRALFTAESERDEACRELPVELIDDSTWWSGVIDRLVLRSDAAGKIAAAVLVDFKTDAVTEAAVLRDRYSAQLALYRRAAALALRLEPKAIQAVLVSTHLGQAVSV